MGLNTAGQIVSIIVLSCMFQVPILYGIIKMSFFSCNSGSQLRRATFDPPSNTEIISPAMVGDDPVKAVEIDQSIPAPSSQRPPPTHQALRAFGHAHYPFVQFSAYRDSPKTFFLIGITSVVARAFDQPVHQCEWTPSPYGSSSSSSLTPPPAIATKAQMIYVYYDQLPRLYVVAMVECTFEEAVGMEGEGEGGGSLFITVSVGPNQGDTERVLAMVEKKDEADDRLHKRDHPPSLPIAYCGPPIHGSVRADWILHWLIYHHHLWKGSAHFFFYNVGGLTDRHRQVLAPFLRGGYLTIIDALDQTNFPSWYHNQLLFTNDCLHRTRYLSSWTFFHDLDEFLFIQKPRSIHQLLKNYKERNFITFGSIPSSTSLCADPAMDPSPWLVQRFLWMKKKPHCLSDQDPWVCLQGPGARKYAVNPRKVTATAVHNTALPQDGGIDLNATIGWMYHYHGVLSAEGNVCEKGVNLSLSRDQMEKDFPEVKDYKRDHAISRKMAKARKFYEMSILKRL